MKSKDLIKMLEKAGWELHSVKGSHHHFKHPNRKDKLTIPHPKKQLPIGTLKQIMKQAGIK